MKNVYLQNFLYKKDFGNQVIFTTKLCENQITSSSLNIYSVTLQRSALAKLEQTFYQLFRHAIDPFPEFLKD